MRHGSEIRDPPRKNEQMATIYKTKLNKIGSKESVDHSDLKIKRLSVKNRSRVNILQEITVAATSNTF